MAMHSLAQQSSSRYELIVVDAIVNESGEPVRKEAAEALARELGVNLAAVVRDKPKTVAKHSKYGLCNAYRARPRNLRSAKRRSILRSPVDVRRS